MCIRNDTPVRTGTKKPSTKMSKGKETVEWKTFPRGKNLSSFGSDPAPMHITYYRVIIVLPCIAEEHRHFGSTGERHGTAIGVMNGDWRAPGEVVVQSYRCAAVYQSKSIGSPDPAVRIMESDWRAPGEVVKRVPNSATEKKKKKHIPSSISEQRKASSGGK